MQFCQSHWDSLRTAITERGLARFIAPDGRAAAEEARRQLEGTTNRAQAPDPLMQAHWMLVSAATDAMGLEIMNPEPCVNCAIAEGHCPLCEVEAGAGRGSALNWINGCADEIRDRFREQGWIEATN